MILLLININANSFGLRTTIVVDTTLMRMPIANDSLYLIDSSQYAEKQTKIRKTSKSIKIITGMLSGAMAAYQASQANGYPMLFYGFLSLGLFISLLIRKKTKTYAEYQKSREKLNIRRLGNPKYNFAWKLSLFLGLIGMIGFIVGALFNSFIFSIIFIISVILTILLFILGFLGRYESKKQKKRGILKGLIGIILPFFPAILFTFLALINVINFGE